MAVFDSGSGSGLVAAGDFTTAGGLAASRIAVWNGSKWSPLGVGLDGTCESLLVFDDGRGATLAPAERSRRLRRERQRIARWNGSAWVRAPGGVNGGAFALTSFDDGAGPGLMAGGLFSLAGGVSARISRNGTVDPGRKPRLRWQPDQSRAKPMTVFDDGSGTAPVRRRRRAHRPSRAGFSKGTARIGSPRELRERRQPDLFLGRVPGLVRGRAGPYLGGDFASTPGTSSWSMARWIGCGHIGVEFCAG